MNNNLTIYYCDSCAKSYGNVYKGNLKNAEFARGYIGGWKHGLEKCPFCGGAVIDTNLPDSDFTIIRDISDYNRQFLESMIQLYNDDVIEYELKMSQFKTQYEQQKSPNQSTQVQNAPKCPYCQSANLKKITATSRLGSTILFGLGSKKIGKQWHCNNCNSDF